MQNKTPHEAAVRCSGGGASLRRRMLFRSKLTRRPQTEGHGCPFVTMAIYGDSITAFSREYIGESLIANIGIYRRAAMRKVL